MNVLAVRSAGAAGNRDGSWQIPAAQHPDTRTILCTGAGHTLEGSLVPQGNGTPAPAYPYVCGVLFSAILLVQCCGWVAWGLDPAHRQDWGYGAPVDWPRPPRTLYIGCWERFWLV
jgi:hypothetical protein